MKIILNGKDYQLSGTTCVAGLLKDLRQEPERVVVELNTVIISREKYQSSSLNDGDKVEIVRLVGGG